MSCCACGRCTCSVGICSKLGGRVEWKVLFISSLLPHSTSSIHPSSRPPSLSMPMWDSEEKLGSILSVRTRKRTHTHTHARARAKYPARTRAHANLWRQMSKHQESAPASDDSAIEQKQNAPDDSAIEQKQNASIGICVPLYLCVYLCSVYICVRVSLCVSLVCFCMCVCSCVLCVFPSF